MQGSPGLSVNTWLSETEPHHVCLWWQDVLNLNRNCHQGTRVVRWGMHQALSEAKAYLGCTVDICPTDLLHPPPPPAKPLLFPLQPRAGEGVDVDAVDVGGLPSVLFCPMLDGKHWSLVVVCGAGTAHSVAGSRTVSSGAVSMPCSLQVCSDRGWEAPPPLLPHRQVRVTPSSCMWMTPAVPSGASGRTGQYVRASQKCMAGPLKTSRRQLPFIRCRPLA